MSNADTTPQRSTRLIRIPVHFDDLADAILGECGATPIKRLGEEYTLAEMDTDAHASSAMTPRFIRWSLPMDHVWPCNPQKMEDFIEKAAQTMLRKFSKEGVQGIFIGQLDPSARDGYYKALATNLRGRTLQLFGETAQTFCKVEEQDPAKPSLFCMVGKEGLYAGIASPRETNGFYPGGTKFISQKAPHMISRAGAKIAEALHYLPLYQTAPAKGAHWLELGACPGGMTSELLERGYRVTAIDRAPLDKRLDGRPDLEFVRTDVAQFTPSDGTRYDAILCDMNGETNFSLGQVVRLSKALKPGGLVVFTLKAIGVTTYDAHLRHYQTALDLAAAGGLRLITRTHLTYNRQEFTLFFEK